MAMVPYWISIFGYAQSETAGRNQPDIAVEFLYPMVYALEDLRIWDCLVR